jgi:hypothetical protein
LFGFLWSDLDKNPTPNKLKESCLVGTTFKAYSRLEQCSFLLNNY